MTRISLKYKLLLYTSLLMAALFMFVYYYFPKVLHQQALANLHDKIDNVAQMTAFGLSAPVYFEDEISAYEVLKGLALVSDILYVRVTDADGIILGAIGDSEFRWQDYVNQAAGDTLLAGKQLFNHTESITHRGRIIGWLYISVSLEKTNLSLAQAKKAIALLSFSLFGGSFFILYIIVAVFLKPIRSLVHSVQAIAAGNLAHRTKVFSHDEVGQLAFVFNDMVDQLETANRDMERTHQNLEEIVKARTEALRNEIMEREHAEKLIQQSEKKYRGLIESMNELLIELDLDGLVIFANKAFYNTTGFTQVEIVGKNYFEFIHQDDLQSTGQQCQALKTTGAIVRQCTYRLRKANDDYIDLIVNADPLITAEGTIGSIVQVCFDITEIKKAAKELQETSRRLLNIIEFLPDATFVVDKDRKIIAWNRAIEKMTGIAKTDMLGQGDYAYALPFYGERTPVIIDKLFGSEIPQESRYDLIEFRDGIVTAEIFLKAFNNNNGIYLSAIASALYDDDRNIVGAIECIRDITAERKLKEQLTHSQKMEAIGRLAGGVAHDFNNLLTVISGYSDIALSRLSQEDNLFKYVTAINKASRQAAGLTNQLLAFSRRQVIQPKVIDLNSVIMDFQKMLARLIGEDIIVKIEPAPQLPKIKMDPVQLEQVVMNLAVNARDAMPAGGELKIITALADSLELAGLPDYDAAQKYLKLVVSDTGIGMSEEIKSKIFEPFFTTKGKGQGTGLGLSTVFGIVNQNKGLIKVNSVIDKGTDFSIYIPAFHTNGELVDDITAPLENLAGNSESILLVEDEADVRAFVTTVFEQAGYNVVTAADAQEALNVLSKIQRFDLLVTDVVMPGMSGTEFSRKVLELLPDIKILFMSGYTDDVVLRYGIEHDAVSFLQKPFTPVSLLSKVRGVLGGEHSN